MRTAFLVSKVLGLRLLNAADLGGALILHPDDSGDCRSVMQDIEMLAAERGAAFRVVFTREDADKALRAFRPEIVLVCGWYSLFKPETLTLAPFYGIHNSLLPKYRGGAPLVWAIINGEREVGSTLFQLGDGVDDGPIAHQLRIDLDRSASIADATAMIEAEWEGAFPEVWRGLCAGTLELRPQQGEPTWFPGRKPADGKIDWSQPAAKVHDFIRAQVAPYPGAFCEGLIFERSSEEPGPGLPMVCGDGKTIYVVTRENGGSDCC